MERQPVSETLICEKLLDMMETIPFQRIKVTEFVKYAGISRSAFYVYFDSIYAVVQKIEDDFISGLTVEDEVLFPDAKTYRADKPSPHTIAKAEYIKKNLQLVRILTGKNGDPAFQARMANRSWRIFQKKTAGLTKLSDPEKKLLSEYMTGGQFNLYRWYATHESEISVYEMAILLERITAQVLQLLH